MNNNKGTTIDSWLLKKQQIELLSNAKRILRCMQEFFKYTKNAKGLISSIKLSKSLSQSLWPESSFVLYQIPKIGEKLSTALVEVLR